MAEDGSESAGLREALAGLRRHDEVWIRCRVMTANLDRWAVAPYASVNTGGTLLITSPEDIRPATLAPAISRPWIDDSDPQKALAESSRPPTQGSFLPPSRADLGGDRTDYNEPYEMAKQRVAIVERVMKLSYIKATRNTETGPERFVCRDDVITTIHDYAKATRAVAESQQSSELVEKTPSALPGERE